MVRNDGTTDLETPVHTICMGTASQRIRSLTRHIGVPHITTAGKGGPLLYTNTKYPYRGDRAEDQLR